MGDIAFGKAAAELIRLREQCEANGLAEVRSQLVGAMNDLDSLHAKIDWLEQQRTDALATSEWALSVSGIDEMQDKLSKAVASAEASDAEAAMLRAKLEKAKEGLEPFAELRVGRFMVDGCHYNYRLDAAWLRRARAVLAELSDGAFAPVQPLQISDEMVSKAKRLAGGTRDLV